MIPAFLAALRERDIQVWSDGEHLRCSAPAGALTAELRAELQARKKDILEFLRCAEALTGQQRAIVPLQPSGGRVPVFGVAGHNGDVFCYRALAQSLGEDQPFYGLQPPGLDGHSEPISRVEDLAAYFAGQIRAFRPDEPYIIAGFCSGGAVAFELAQQLLRGGATIHLLALFGCPYPASYRLIPQAWLRTRQNLARMLEQTRKISAMPARRRHSYIFEKLRTFKVQRTAERQSGSDWISDLRKKVERATISGASRYRPACYMGRVSLILPCKGWVSCGYQALRWRSLAENCQEHFGPEGCNADNMLREPNAVRFAKLFTVATQAHAGSETMSPATELRSVLSPP